jgi:hypothetical protein
MRKSQALFVGLAVVAGYAMAVALNRPSAGQPPAADPLPARQPGPIWRFHTTVINGGGSYPLLILTDTTDGHCWLRDSSPQDDDEWRDLGTPGAARKEASAEPTRRPVRR